MAPVIRGTLNISPKAQIKGSAVGKPLTNLVDKNEPKGTPIIPAIIVMAPNLKDTLFCANNITRQKVKRIKKYCNIILKFVKSS